MAEKLRIALAGLGTVGAGVIKLLAQNQALIERRAGRGIEIVAVSARDRARDRGVDLSRFEWVDDTASLAARDDVDAVVELIGGSDGPALTLARAALSHGKAFVTANKAMVAHHGLELAAAAEAGNTALKYEAAVAGGIPVIKGLREGAAANVIDHVYGVLNGTCNYILTTMESEGRDFTEVLSEAQPLGYAEADPTLDVDGIDDGAGHLDGNAPPRAVLERRGGQTPLRDRRCPGREGRASRSRPEGQPGRLRQRSGRGRERVPVLGHRLRRAQRRR